MMGGGCQLEALPAQSLRLQYMLLQDLASLLLVPLHLHLAAVVRSHMHGQPSFVVAAVYGAAAKAVEGLPRVRDAFTLFQAACKKYDEVSVKAPCCQHPLLCCCHVCRSAASLPLCHGLGHGCSCSAARQWEIQSVGASANMVRYLRPAIIAAYAAVLQLPS
jgi:hypothetical protein